MGITLCGPSGSVARQGAQSRPADRLSELLGVPKSTMAGEAKLIRDALGLDTRLDVELCRRELLEDHHLRGLSRSTA